MYCVCIYIYIYACVYKYKDLQLIGKISKRVDLYTMYIFQFTPYINLCVMHINLQTILFILICVFHLFLRVDNVSQIENSIPASSLEIRSNLVYDMLSLTSETSRPSLDFCTFSFGSDMICHLLHLFNKFPHIFQLCQNFVFYFIYLISNSLSL